MRALQPAECEQISGGLTFSNLDMLADFSLIGGLIAGGLQLNFPASLLSLAVIESVLLANSPGTFAAGNPTMVQKYVFGALLGTALGSASYWSSFYAAQYFTETK